MSTKNVYDFQSLNRAARRHYQPSDSARALTEELDDRREEMRFQDQYIRMQKKAHMPLTLVIPPGEELVTKPMPFKKPLIDVLEPYILIAGFFGVIFLAALLGTMAINYTSGLPLLFNTW